MYHFSILHYLTLHTGYIVICLSVSVLYKTVRYRENIFLFFIFLTFSSMIPGTENATNQMWVDEVINA